MIRGTRFVEEKIQITPRRLAFALHQAGPREQSFALGNKWLTLSLSIDGRNRH